MPLLIIIVETLWYFLPAMAANMAPVFAAKYNWLERLNVPLDGGARWNDKALLGANKTVRGLLVGVATAAVIGWLQGNLWLGAGLGLGALAGDTVKSFFKRRLDYLSGQSWKPWDQIDFVMGAIVVSLVYSPLTLIHYTTAIVLIGLGSYLVSYLGVKTKIKKTL